MKGRGTDGKPAWSVMKNAQKHLDRALSFYYEDYSATKRGQMRIDAAILTLLNDGIITRDPVREKQWINCQMVKNLVTAVLTIAGCFSLVLQAATGSRAGDFGLSAHYTGDEHIKWQDIQLAVTIKDGKPTLTMLVKLLWVKNHK
jgi:hypothetical protein